MRFVFSNPLVSLLIGLSLLGTPSLSWQRSPAVLLRRTSSTFRQSIQRPQHHADKWTTTRLSALLPPAGEAVENSALYKLLAVPDVDNEKAGSNFFYNDEVISHLHGYMLLVGLFGARDPFFLLSFCGLATFAAGATLAKKLPANPRVPALVAVITFVLTVAIRYALQFYEVPVPEVMGWRGGEEQGARQNMYFEALIVALNVAWGCWGSWQTNQPLNGASN